MNTDDKKTFADIPTLEEILGELHYQQCETDESKSFNIKEGKRPDYLFDEPHASFAREFLEKRRLPMPPADKIYRGSHHDILFLSNGLVLRFGPTDIESIINPAFQMPIGWAYQTNEHGGRLAHDLGVTMTFGSPQFENSAYQRAIYGTVEKSKEFDFFKKLVFWMGNYADDLRKPSNLGLMQVRDGELPLIMALDIDNEFNGAISDNVFEYTRRFQSNPMRLKSQILRDIIVEKLDYFRTSGHLKSLFQAHPELMMGRDILQSLLDAFNQHQPLRNCFWRAANNDWSGKSINPKYLEAFYKMAYVYSQPDWGYKFFGRPKHAQEPMDKYLELKKILEQDPPDNATFPPSAQQGKQHILTARTVSSWQKWKGKKRPRWEADW